MEKITFIDFIKSLISETISAVSEAQYQQENKILELKEDLMASNKVLIEKYDLFETAKIDLGEKAKESEINDYVASKIGSIRQGLSIYFENGYVKTVVDKGKISAKFICNINTGDDENKDNNALKLKNSTDKYPNLPKIDEENRFTKIEMKPDALFEYKDKKLEKIAKNITIKTIDVTKDKDVIDSSQNLVSSVDIEFRTVIVN